MDKLFLNYLLIIYFNFIESRMCLFLIGNRSIFYLELPKIENLFSKKILRKFNVRHLSYSTIIIFLILLFKNIKKLLLKMKFKILNKSIIKKLK